MGRRASGRRRNQRAGSMPCAVSGKNTPEGKGYNQAFSQRLKVSTASAGRS
jgi:hypothetical protein